MNFYVGNQQCTVNGNQELMPLQAKYFWQEHQVFNHIAPIVERRLSKLARIRPKMNVMPASNDEKTFDELNSMTDEELLQQRDLLLKSLQEFDKKELS